MEIALTEAKNLDDIRRVFVPLNKSIKSVVNQKVIDFLEKYISEKILTVCYI